MNTTLFVIPADQSTPLDFIFSYNDAVLLSGQTLNFTSPSLTACVFDPLTTDNILTILGTLAGGTAIVAGDSSVDANARREHFIVGTSGVVIGDGDAIDTHGGLYRIDNFGLIKAGADGIHMTAASGEALGVVTNKGIIEAEGSAIEANGGLLKLVNTGTISGTTAAIVMGTGTAIITNRGDIIGDVTLGNGNDVFDNRHGSVSGDINLGAGSDTYKPGADNGTVDGGGGENTLDFASAPMAIHFSLDGSVNSSGWASTGVYLHFQDVVGASAFANVLVGDAGDNLLVGGQVGNRLAGGAGDDVLIGGNGADTLIGGPGHDILTGGLGADKFVFAGGDFAGPTRSTCDEITDFSHADGDKLVLSAVDANTTVAGNQAFTWIGTAAFHHVAGELRYDYVGPGHADPEGCYVAGDTNGDGVADFLIALDAVTSLVKADIVL